MKEVVSLFRVKVREQLGLDPVEYWLDSLGRLGAALRENDLDNSPIQW